MTMNIYDASIGMRGDSARVARTPAYATFRELLDHHLAPEDIHRSASKGGRYATAAMALDHRNADNAASRAWLGFDIDKMRTEEEFYTGLLGGLIESGHEFHYYHTSSSMKDGNGPRLRVFVPLTSALNREDLERAHDLFWRLFIAPHMECERDYTLDRAEQPIYLPLQGQRVESHDDMTLDLWNAAEALELVSWPSVTEIRTKRAQRRAEERKRLTGCNFHIDSKSGYAWVYDLSLNEAITIAGHPKRTTTVREALKELADSAEGKLRVSIEGRRVTGGSCSFILRLGEGDGRPMVTDNQDCVHYWLDDAGMCELVPGFDPNAWHKARVLELVDALPWSGQVPGTSLIPLQQRYTPAQAEENAGYVRQATGADEEERAGVYNSTMTAEDMAQHWVLIGNGGRIVDSRFPGTVFKFEDMRRITEHCFEDVQTEDGKVKRKLSFDLWRYRDKRRVHEVTFEPGGPQLTYTPVEYERAFNTWAGWRHPTVAPDPKVDEAFTEHVRYLFGGATDHFLDWVAHIAQHPEERQQTGWLHIAPCQGTGRGWLGLALGLAFSGYCDPVWNLMHCVSKGYTGSMSRKLLLIVDESKAPEGESKWSVAEWLKTHMSAPTIRINPKGMPEVSEYSRFRLLICSNNDSALAIDASDRRFWVARCDAPVKPEEYYVGLYDLLKDPRFGAKLLRLLLSRDLSAYNFGQRPEMSEEKAAAIDASKSWSQVVLERLIAGWPSDVVPWHVVDVVLADEEGQQGKSYSRIAKNTAMRLGIRQWGTMANRPRMNGRLVLPFIIRNHAQWVNADGQAVLDEMKRGISVGGIIPSEILRTFNEHC